MLNDSSPKKITLSSARPHVTPNLYDFLLQKTKYILKNIGNQEVLVIIDKVIQDLNDIRLINYRIFRVYHSFKMCGRDPFLLI